MAGHTEGPWRYYAGSHSIWQQVGGTDGRCICIVTGPRKTLDPERLANARLIASAPELLSECTDALDTMVKLRADLAEEHAERHAQRIAVLDLNIASLTSVVARATGAAS
jgi:hypothetical protein